MSLVHDILNTLDSFFAATQANIPLLLRLLALLWGVNLINWMLLGGALNQLGIVPRTGRGLVGILFAPILHGSPTHLFYNSIPLVILLDFLLWQGASTLWCTTGLIVILSGLAVWLIGRRGVHIGASSLIMGYWGYLIINAYYHPSIASIIIAVLTLYYLASLALSLFPSEITTSWEGHVTGFLAGVAAVYLCPQLSYFI